MHTYIHAYIHTYIHTYIRTGMHTYVHTVPHWFRFSLTCIGRGCSHRNDCVDGQANKPDLNINKPDRRWVEPGCRWHHRRQLWGGLVHAHRFPSECVVDGRPPGDVCRRQGCALLPRGLCTGGVTPRVLWWQVVVYNRVDCCSERLSNAVRSP
jgi:hypothetical protein